MPNIHDTLHILSRVVLLFVFTLAFSEEVFKSLGENNYRRRKLLRHFPIILDPWKS